MYIAAAGLQVTKIQEHNQVLAVVVVVLGLVSEQLKVVASRHYCYLAKRYPKNNQNH